MIDKLARHRRALNALGFAAMAALLAAAYGLEYLGALEPCPLCLFQRMVVVALAVVFLAAALHDPRGRGCWIYAAVVGVVGATGIGIALRHLWLQSLPPDQVPACGPGLDYMLDTMPVTQALTRVLQGTGDCAEVAPVLGLPIPLWTLGAFVAALGWGVTVNIRRKA